MKLRTLARLAIIVSVVLLCVGIGVYSYLRLQSVEHRRSVNLFTLVPQDAEAVFETDRLVDFIDDLNGMESSQDGYLLHFSELFSGLSTCLQSLADENPHGISSLMNKVLVSHHAPAGEQNEVLYCTFGKGSRGMIEKFIQRYTSSQFPSKTFEYKGHDIQIYPMTNGQFLAAYISDTFLAISFQKRLIEQVIDARDSHQSLADNSEFASLLEARKGGALANLYLQMNQVQMGSKDEPGYQASLGNWTQFDIRFKERIAYLSGINSVRDTTTFLSTLLGQQSVEGFNGDLLPDGTFYYNRCGFSHPDSLLDFLSPIVYHRHQLDASVQRFDSLFSRYLCEYTDGDFLTCFFRGRDTLRQEPYAVLSISLHDVEQAETQLRRHFTAQPDAYTHLSSGEKLYRIPSNTVLLQLCGLPTNGFRTYAAFCGNRLVMAPDAASLSAYVQALVEERVEQGGVMFDETTSSLSANYVYAMLADLEHFRGLSADYAKLIPHFFFCHEDFFKHFTIGFQITTNEEGVHPNVVLIYKAEE